MNQFSLSFPESSVICAGGDYLICHHAGEGWKVYRVDDLLLVKRLVPLVSTPSILLIEEHMLDSKTPAYSNDVQLLVTAYDSSFLDESEALKAIQLQTLTERANGLLRSARDFPESHCRVVHEARDLDERTDGASPD